ncbi:hypothetical protein FRX31_018101 [Thalictrum thalictroides]|uniref:Uncharacterized protein n=1 Tax=Thalictrum thalictroides TaxID=46969 RepID=A0A7J6W774_THATH|nr:hypothetical protein FRX31_018101 [Thalictrum thalictroides]
MSFYNTLYAGACTQILSNYLFLDCIHHAENSIPAPKAVVVDGWVSCNCDHPSDCQYCSANIITLLRRYP